MNREGNDSRLDRSEGELSRPHYLKKLSVRSYSLLSNAVREGGADLVTIAEIVEKDPELTAQVLGLTNSAMFALKHRVDSVRQAVALLGAKRLRQFLGVSPGPDASRAVADFPLSRDAATQQAAADPANTTEYA